MDDERTPIPSEKAFLDNIPPPSARNTLFLSNGILKEDSFNERMNEY